MRTRRRQLIVLAAVAAVYFATYADTPRKPAAVAKAPKKLTQAHHQEKQWKPQSPTR